jgi:hypothetical protein
VTGGDVFSSAMPSDGKPRIPVSRAAPATTDALVLDRLLDGVRADPDGEECRNGGLDMVAALLVRIAGPADSDETEGLATATAMFREVLGPVSALGGGPPLADSPRSASRKGARSSAARSLARLPRWRLLAAGVAASTVFGGMAAAYAGALPAGLQTVAHDVIGAPAPPAHQPPAAHHQGGANQDTTRHASGPAHPGSHGDRARHTAAGGPASPRAASHHRRQAAAGTGGGHAYGHSSSPGSQPANGRGQGQGRSGAPGRSHANLGHPNRGHQKRGHQKRGHSSGGGNPGHQSGGGLSHGTGNGHGQAHGNGGSGNGQGAGSGHGRHGQ